MATPLDRLSKRTYVVRHSPNCPMPFEVRLCGRRGYIDMEHRSKTGDYVGYGKTLKEAVSQVIQATERKL